MNEPYAHCCTMMHQQAESSCPDHPDRYGCPGALIDFTVTGPYAVDYRLLVHDGGTSRVSISYCPFCGRFLGERDE